MKREEVDTYKIEENQHSGLELELHFMPKFFHMNLCGSMPPHVHEFYQIIWFRRVHTVQEYADLLNISSRTLTKYVAQSTSRSPLQMINDRIVLEAKRQLLHTSMSVKEIGYQLGFEDPSYFVKFFKRLTGKMPGEFRSV